ncbi:hypothetical protein KCU79_g13, partial [Aureobasidium melanogenum]
MGPPPKDGPDSANRAHSFSAIVARAASDQSTSSKSTAQPRNWTVFRKPGTKRPQAPDTSIKYRQRSIKAVKSITSGSVPRATFTRLKELSVCGNALRGSSLQAVAPMFNPSLEQLHLWARTHDQQQELGDHLGRDLLSHISTTCHNLTSLSLESYLRLSSADLYTFFRSMGQLKALRLGMEMNSKGEGTKNMTKNALRKL